MAARMAVDDRQELLRLAESGAVVLTPSQDFDDSYCIHYARQKRGVIVTNDQFDDFLAKQDDEARAKRWLRRHSAGAAADGCCNMRGRGLRLIGWLAELVREIWAGGVST